MQEEESNFDVEIKMAEGMLALGESLTMTGRYMQALDSIGQAESIYRSRGNIRYTYCMMCRANVNGLMGKSDEALREYQAMIDLLIIYMKEKKMKLNDADVHLNDIAYCYERIGRNHLQSRKLEEALVALKDSKELYLNLFKRNETRALYFNGYLNSNEVLGNVYLELKQYENAHNCFEEFYEGIKILMIAFPDRKALNFDLARAAGKMGHFEMIKGRYTSSLPYYKQAIRCLRGNWQIFKNRPDVCSEYAMILEQTGILYSNLGNIKAAKMCYQACANMHLELYENFPGNPWYKELFTEVLNRMGNLLADQHLYKDAQECFNKSLAIRLRLMEKQPDSVQLKMGIGLTYQKIGDLYNSQLDFANALSYYTLFYENCCEVLRYTPGFSQQLSHMVIAHNRLAQVQRAMGNFESASWHGRQAREFQKKLHWQFHENVKPDENPVADFKEIAENYQKEKERGEA